ncbi:MAG: DEAD/DEAH box helicase family protein, partial [Caldisericia bacterium]|nr:DEAD/DEAH box helicase family protein [Caldisericia bacterium]
HWETNLNNISSPALQTNWEQNFDAFDEIILRNSKDRPSMKICCPSPTGSGKTQQIIAKAIDLFGTKTGTLIVTMRTEDADLIAKQIMDSTSEDYVAVFHSKDVSVDSVRKAENHDEAQCLIITHEKFRRQEKTITVNRDFIAIDEAIDVISHYQIDQINIEGMIKILEQKQNLEYKGKKEKMLASELDLLKSILDVQFGAIREQPHSFHGAKPSEDTIRMAALPEMQFTQAKKLFELKSVKPSAILTGYQNDNIDSAVKKNMTTICENLKYFFTQFSFMAKNGYQTSWSIASELIPGKSLVVMDATASVNKAYDFYMKYQPERLKILPAIECRNYSNVTIHTARTATGRNTILGKEKDENEKVKKESAKTIVNAVMESTKPGDDVLVVTFNELEPTVITYAESIDDRRIRVDHWGNLTGTNKYNTCNKIIIYGLNHKPGEKQRSMHALIKSPEMALLHTEENTMEFNELVRSDIVAEVIQAINRGLCRNVIDSDGNCEPTDVYLTLPAHYGSATEMMIAIKSEMHDIKEAEWTVAKEDNKTLVRTSFLESFILQLNVLLDSKAFDVKLQDVLDALSVDRKQWRDHIKGHKNFSSALDASEFGMEMRHRVDRRGKKLKTLEPWF